MNENKKIEDKLDALLTLVSIITGILISAYVIRFLLE